MPRIEGAVLEEGVGGSIDHGQGQASAGGRQDSIAVDQEANALTRRFYARAA